MSTSIVPKYQLFAQDQITGEYVQLDILEGNSLVMTLSVYDLDGNAGDYTNNFRIGNQDQNGKFFNDAFNVNGTNFDPTKPCSAYIMMNGSYFRSGSIYLKAVHYNGRLQSYEYEVEFRGVLGDLATSIGASRILSGATGYNGVMADLDLSRYNIDWWGLSSSSAVLYPQTSWFTPTQKSYFDVTGSYLPSGVTGNGIFKGDILFPLVEWGYSYDEIKNVPNIPTISAGYTQSFTGASAFGTVGATGLLLGQMKPAIRAKVLWDQIFKEAGFTYQSEFLGNMGTTYGGGNLDSYGNVTDFANLYCLLENQARPQLFGSANFYCTTYTTFDVSLTERATSSNLWMVSRDTGSSILNPDWTSYGSDSKYVDPRLIYQDPNDGSGATHSETPLDGAVISNWTPWPNKKLSTYSGGNAKVTFTAPTTGRYVFNVTNMPGGTAASDYGGSGTPNLIDASVNGRLGSARWYSDVTGLTATWYVGLIDPSTNEYYTDAVYGNTVNYGFYIESYAPGTTGGNVGPTEVPAFPITSFTAYIDLLANQQVCIQHTAVTGGHPLKKERAQYIGGRPGSYLHAFYRSYINCSFDCTSWPSSGSIQSMLPTNAKQIDFIRAISDKFKLVFTPDPNNPKNFSSIEPWINWIKSGKTVDWSHLVDYSKDIVSTPLFLNLDRQIYLHDAEDADYNNYNYQQNVKIPYGWKIVDSGIPIIKETNEPKSFFAPTPISSVAYQAKTDPSGYYPGTLDIPLTTPKWLIPHVSKFETGAYSATTTNLPINKVLPILPQMRLLYYAGLLPTPAYTGADINQSRIFPLGRIPWAIEDNMTAGATAVAQWYQSYPLLSEVNIVIGDQTSGTINTSSSSESLLWDTSNAISSDNNFGVGVSSIFDNYWNTWYQSYYDKRSLLTEMYIRLSPGDVLDFQFNTRVWIKDAYYFVVKIEDFVIGEVNVCKVQLLKLNNLQA